MAGETCDVQTLGGILIHSFFYLTSFQSSPVRNIAELTHTLSTKMTLL